MADGEQGADSFEVVWEFLQGLGGARPGPEQVMALAPALREIHGRMVRVQRVAPQAEVGLSDEVWELMELAGVAARPSRVSPFRSAASFL